MPFFDNIRMGSSAAATGGGGLTVDRSLRFNYDDTGYLNRTSGTSTSQYKFTYSVWLKLGRAALATSNYGELFNGYDGNNNNSGFGAIYFYNGVLRFAGWSGSHRATNRIFRDPSAWYHIVVAVDTTLSTADNRQKIYINGVEETSFSSSNNLSQNSTCGIGNNSAVLQIGRDNSASSDRAFDGYMTEINYIDGQQLTPSSFGETNATTGQWVPISTSGLTFGTNGFRLQFAENSGTTATTLGKDTSGNSNNFTPNNFSIAAGEGNDSVTDTPTKNFPTLNLLDKASTISLKNANLQISDVNNQNYDGIRASFGTKTGKYYWEIKFPSTGYISSIGIARADGRIDTGNEPTYRIVLGLGSWFNSYNSGGVATYVNATPTADYPSVATWSGASNYSNNDIYMIAVDFDSGKIWWGKNNSWFNNSGTANPATGTDPRLTFTTGNEWFPYSQEGDSSSSPQAYNFGQQGFAYTPPSGFVALSSENLPDPTLLLPKKHFDTVLYTGDGNATGSQPNVLEFKPDWLWTKSRNAAYSHMLYDSVRGAGNSKGLNLGGGTSAGAGTEGAGADNAVYGYLNSFDANGFSYTKGSAGTTYFNQSGINYVNWTWNAGDTDSKTYKVKVVSDSTDYGHGTGSNKYQFFKSDGTTGFGTNGVDLDLEEGGTYIFDWSDSSAQSHPIRFSLTNDGTHSSGTSAGSEYTTGVTKDDSAYKTTITIASGVANLFYYCQNHSGMGAEINTNSTLGSSNFDGTKQATVKANAIAGFSIGTYTAQSSGSITVGHGLGVAPSVVITKSRTVTSNWYSYHQAIGQDGWIFLNDSGAATTSNSAVWNPAPTSSVFTYGSGLVNFGDVVFYAFSEVSGYSKFGSYTGNGSSDGTFVFTGFRPAWVMTKRTDSSDHWNISDAKRGNFNEIDEALYANNVQAEGWNGSLDKIDYLSNGFKIRANNSQTNASGGTYIYLAFAESPFKNARAR